MIIQIMHVCMYLLFIVMLITKFVYFYKNKKMKQEKSIISKPMAIRNVSMESRNGNIERRK
ncbi:hypothetical protein DMS23_07895 [Klebsiella variicola]|nr:hypothetical protein DMS23_07895 [Klebsiella variicola]